VANIREHRSADTQNDRGFRYGHCSNLIADETREVKANAVGLWTKGTRLTIRMNDAVPSAVARITRRAPKRIAKANPITEILNGDRS
jgi:hypothetical protein